MGRGVTGVDARPVLVTGATGFLGGHVARQLIQRGQRVRVLLRDRHRPVALEGLQYEIAQGDVRDDVAVARAVDGCRHVYHAAAAIVFWCANQRALDDLREINVGGTRTVLRAAEAAGVERVLHVSTVDAIGLPPPGSIADEQTDFAPGRIDTPYAETKREAEHVAREAAVWTVVVNPGFLVGPFDSKPSSGRLLMPLMTGRVVGYPVRGGNNFVDVRDVATGAIAALERGRRGERYILGGINLSYRDLFDRALSVLERRPLRLPLPCWTVRGAGIVSDAVGSLTGHEPPLTASMARLACADHFYRSDKAIRELGYTPSPLGQALRDAFAWYAGFRGGTPP
jgi:dihydroflavonol-4-reductase